MNEESDPSSGGAGQGGPAGESPASPGGGNPSEDLAAAPGTVPDYQNRRASDAHPVKRKLVTALVALYAVSALAAAAVLWRSQARKSESGESAGQGLKSAAGGILAAVKKKDSVGFLRINGPIYSPQSSGLMDRGSNQWARRIEKLAKKDEVKAIVLAINSPGGSVGAVQEIYSVLQRARKETGKPIVAHLGDVAASGGYYLAATCDQIVAHPGSLVGSIGVIFNNSNFEGLFAKVGVKMAVIKSGKMKDIGSMSRPMTEEERRLLQELIDNAYGQFFRAVADGRKKLSDEQIKPLADGRIFTGEQALANGLVDSLGDTQDAILVAAKLGGIKDEKPNVYRGEVDSFSEVFELFDSRLRLYRSPELALLGELREMAGGGLEYRWMR